MIGLLHKEDWHEKVIFNVFRDLIDRTGFECRSGTYFTMDWHNWHIDTRTVTTTQTVSPWHTHWHNVYDARVNKSSNVKEPLTIPPTALDP